MKLNDESLLKRHAYINGEWVAAEGRFELEVTNPSTGEVIASVPDLGVDSTSQAIEAAHAAWPDWRNRTARERSDIMKRWHTLIMENRKDLATILTSEMGKPFKEAYGEIAYGASFIEWYAEEAKRVYGDVIPAHGTDKRLVVIKQPVGVVGAITPWNFPCAMITRKCAPGLAVGCPIVIKPAEDTPLTALALAELADRAGFPKGIINIITTSNAADVGGEITRNDKVRKITFTGSTEVGRILMRQSADTIKKVSFELGGNAPFIVFDDADLDAAVDGAIASKYRNSGQTCICANRLYVQDGIYDRFVEKLTEKVAALKVGDGFEEGVAQGPLINDAAVDKVEELLGDAVSQGASVVTGGKRHALGGTFFEPTVLRDVTQDMRLSKEEVFGPVAPVFRFSDDADVVAKANDTIFGLAAYFYARDIGRVWRVAEELEYGLVAVNTGLMTTEVAPFGGYKQSGIGREGSKYGIDDFVELKYICMGGI
ncbi:NAD-dependent succinate-semialdehyde dehydrogenase [Yunchengibacter salinarum]|uniref:NAD-dependent succinate-semialdehyde dehydrogenase n=1 Tax=Yunchengibacter salinarum TaxID=3133399 RepID=UPI0035B5B0DF